MQIGDKGGDERVPEGLRSELLAEHAALRAEILKRIEFRHQLTAIALTAAAALLSAGVASGNAAVMLILPLLIPFLAIAWVHNDLRVGDIAIHIRTRIEAVLPGITWETRLQESRSEKGGHLRWRRTVVSQLGVFVVIQVIGVSVGVLRAGDAGPEWALLIVDAGAILGVVLIMGKAIFRYTGPPSGRP